MPQKQPSWLQAHAPFLLSLALLGVTTYLSIDNRIPESITTLILGGLGALTLLLHAWDKSLPVVPLSSLESLVEKLTASLLPQALPLLGQEEMLVSQAEGQGAQAVPSPAPSPAPASAPAQPAVPAPAATPAAPESQPMQGGAVND